jgi:hypothetical protein
VPLAMEGAVPSTSSATIAIMTGPQ